MVQYGVRAVFGWSAAVDDEDRQREFAKQCDISAFIYFVDWPEKFPAIEAYDIWLQSLLHWSHFC
jgi:hypothetical protein